MLKRGGELTIGISKRSGGEREGPPGNDLVVRKDCLADSGLACRVGVWPVKQNRAQAKLWASKICVSTGLWRVRLGGGCGVWAGISRPLAVDESLLWCEAGFVIEVSVLGHVHAQIDVGAVGGSGEFNLL